MMQSGVPLCNTCGEQLGVNDNEEVFVACHHCNFPICKACLEHEINEGSRGCVSCGTPYEERTEDDGDIKIHENQSTLASQLSNSQDVGLHARHISTVSTVDSELHDESGNPIWKNRVESWKGKDKKSKKKKAPKADIEAPVPSEQQMEERKPTEASAEPPLSIVVPISKTKLAPYRTVIIVRLIILGLFFHYRVTNPVDSAFARGHRNSIRLYLYEA